jgi:hypothetical protein
LLDPDRERLTGHDDPDRYQFQANEKVEKVLHFSRKYQYAVQNTEFMTHLTLALVWLKVKKEL